MSGEPDVELSGGAVTTRLVGALARLGELATSFVLVGGVAVAARLAHVHRVTTDLDALTSDDEFEQAVVALPEGAMDGRKLMIGGVVIDQIPVDAEVTWEMVAALDEPIDRLFTAAHLWALRTAEPLCISAGSVSATVPVAVVPALLATKLHAYCSSRRGATKRGGDALDVFRLARLLVQTGVPGFADAPEPVIDAVRWAIQEQWHRDPVRFVRRLRELGSNIPPVPEADVVTLAELLLESLPH